MKKKPLRLEVNLERLDSVLIAFKVIGAIEEVAVVVVVVVAVDVVVVVEDVVKIWLGSPSIFTFSFISNSCCLSNSVSSIGNSLAWYLPFKYKGSLDGT